MNIIGYKYVSLGASAALVGVAILAIVGFGFTQGIDFEGGTLWQFRVRSDAPSASELEDILKTDAGVENATARYDEGDGTFFVRLPAADEAAHGEYLGVLEHKLGGVEELSFQTIGPSIGQRLRRNAFIALALALVAVSLYIAFVFRKASRPVSSWKYGAVTLLTLFHDVLLPAGLLAILGRYAGVEIDSNFIVALLVVMGFSVHDTIVVFDRIRENLSLDRGRSEFSAIINKSVNETLRRSVFTSLTLVVVLVALYFIGPASLAYFIMTLFIGIAVGTYSSIFVASPMLLFMKPKTLR